MECREDDRTLECEPVVASRIQGITAMSARDQSGSDAPGGKAHRVDEVSGDIAVIGTFEVVVHPCEKEAHHGDFHASEESSRDKERGDDRHQKSSSLGWGKPSGGERSPCFVYRIFGNRVWKTLIRDREGQDVQPHPEKSARQAGDDREELRR